VLPIKKPARLGLDLLACGRRRRSALAASATNAVGSFVLSRLNRVALQWGSRRPPEAAASLEALCPRSPQGVANLRGFVDDVNRAGGTYHRLDFGGGLTLAGDYDLRRYLHLYRLPETLAGKTVLDIGTAAGFFALECARRGAKVVALDIYDEPLLTGLLSHLEADVQYVKSSVYDMRPPARGYDLVVCGSLLLHLPDPLGAIQRIRAVCAGQAIVATACPAYSWLTRRPVCEFRGRKAVDGEYHHWWEIGAVALARMMRAAGFSQVENVRHFILESEPGRTPFATPHVVLTAS
jgi:2-polyprenyl-3-methyl-5-hydroxy-6-metoxy-1,4-benzoquinol methylase